MKQGPETEVPPIEIEGMKQAVMNGRKVHGDWDRKKRDLDGTIGLSKEHPNTQGCKFEKDLELMIEQGSKLDSQYLNLERKYNSKAQMQAADEIWGAICSGQAPLEMFSLE